MIEPEVLLPVLSKDEDTDVEDVLASSQELIPSVQVTLAKRILRPGSNKVLCMAARTSVPFNDDEKASVSDMALRLSDGTNVKLTLSFFNEGDSNDLVPPLKRLNYVPEHYAATQAAPNFGQVIAATCMIAITCFYYMAKSPSGIQANPFSQSKASVSVHHSSVAALVPVAVRSATVAKESLRSAPQAAMGVKPAVKAKTVFSSSHARMDKASRNSNAHNDAFFVPPPPPITYSYLVRPMPFMTEPQGNFQNSVEPVRPSTSKVRAQNSVGSPVTKAATMPDNGGVAFDWLPTPAPSITQKYENRKLLPQVNIHKTIDAEAPSPGSEKGYPQLERIVLPGSN